MAYISPGTGSARSTTSPATPASSAGPRLTAKQRAFAEAYATSGNACAAARAAGYTEESALNSHRLAKHPRIRIAMEAIDQHRSVNKAPDSTPSATSACLTPSQCGVVVDVTALKRLQMYARGFAAVFNQEARLLLAGQIRPDRIAALAALLDGLSVNLSELSDCEVSVESGF